jgi:anti-sigma regulatory factor (Ser/Thr protein kinase)
VVSADCDTPLSEPPSGRTFTFPFASGHLAEVRRHAVGWMQHTGLNVARRGDLLLAIAEAMGNSVAHGGGGGVLRLWSAGAHGCVAEVSDSGYLTDPLAGRRKPGLGTANGGRGLWMIHQLCDLVEVRAQSTGLVLRMHMSRPLPQAE